MSLVVYSAEECAQSSDAWRAARVGLPTASRFSDVLAKGQGISRRKYMYQLAGEIITGEPMESYSNGYMERGKAQEDEARIQFEILTDLVAAPVGFMTQFGAGASPDSLIGEDELLEIKTRSAHLQCEVLETFAPAKPPSENLAQVMGQVWVSGRKRVHLVSYCRGMPMAKWVIERDEAYIANLSAEVTRFNAELAAMVERIRGMA